MMQSLLVVSTLLSCFTALSNAHKHHHHNSNEDGLCKKHILKRPDKDDKILSARWLVHKINWGVLSTISSRDLDVPSDTDTNSSHQSPSIPFGNVVSFVDGPCNTTTGIPYLYVTNMDQSMKDIHVNKFVSLTVSEASSDELYSSKKTCSYHPYSDPENPPCARLVVTGIFKELNDEVEESKKEANFGKQAFFERHPAMKYWPDNHGFFVGKIEIIDLWFLDWFGGASILNTTEYLNADMSPILVNKGKGEKHKNIDEIQDFYGKRTDREETSEAAWKLYAQELGY